MPNRSLTVQIAPLVSSSSPPTSAQYNKLMKAMNDILFTGVGDGVWRIFVNTVNQVRNFQDYSGFSALYSNDTNLTTSTYDATLLNTKNPLAQFSYGYLPSPMNAEESVRLTTFSGSIVFGDTDPDDVEACYSRSMMLQGVYDPHTNDIQSPAIYCPRQTNFYQATDNIFGDESVYTDWGGFGHLPTGDKTAYSSVYNGATVGNIIGMCNDWQPEPGGSFVPQFNYQLIFTNKKTGHQEKYNGTCGWTNGNYFVSNMSPDGKGRPQRLFVYQITDAVIGDVLPHGNNPLLIKEYDLNLWELGPYEGSGGWLGKNNIYPQMESLINSYCKDFRGKTSDWQDYFYDMANSFDTDKFLASQYLLAPHYGTSSNYGDKVTRQNVIFSLGSGSYPTDTYFSCSRPSFGPYFYKLHSGFTIGKVLVKQKNVTGSIVFDIYTPDTWSFDTGITVPTTNSYMKTYPIQNPSSSFVFTIKTAGPITIGNGGYIQIFADEQLKYNPDYLDLYYVLRLSTFSQGGDDFISESLAADSNIGRTLSDNYFTCSCPIDYYSYIDLDNELLGANNIINQYGKGPLSWIRATTPDDLVGYETVIENHITKSVVYYQENINSYFAPVLDINHYSHSNNKLEYGWQYLVTGSIGVTGSVFYGSASYNLNDYFTASYPYDSFSQITGSPTIRLINNIVHMADTRSYANEWYALPILYPWGPSDTSTGEVHDFVDFYQRYIIANRAWTFLRINNSVFDKLCRMGVVDLGMTELDQYGNLGQDGDAGNDKMQASYTSEYPSGYNFYGDTLTSINRLEQIVDAGDYESDYGYDEAGRNLLLADYCKSNPIYQPPMSVDRLHSAVTKTINGKTYTNLMAMYFTERVHSTGSKSYSLSSIASWNCQDEPIRTVENAMVDWLVYKNFQIDGVNYVYTLPSGPPGRVSHKVGDLCGAPYRVGDWYQVPQFSLPVSFFMVKAMPYCYEDFNNIPEITDSRMECDDFIQLEYYIKNICGGFAAEGIKDKTMIDLYRNNVFDTNIDLQGFSFLSDYNYQKLLYDALGTLIPISTKNDVLTKGFGLSPLAGCKLWADQVNQYSQMLRLLTKARLMLPYSIASSQNITDVITQTSDQFTSNHTFEVDENACAIDYHTQHIPVPDNFADGVTTLSSEIVTGYIYRTNMPAQQNLGYNNYATSYKIKIPEGYNNAIAHFGIADVNNQLNLTAIDETNEYWYVVNWTTAPEGDDCFTGKYSYQYDPAHKPCDIFKIVDNVTYYAHYTEYSSSLFSAYQSPSSVDITIAGTGKGDIFVAGTPVSNPPQAAFLEYTIDRSITFLQNAMIISLKQVDLSP